MPDSLEFGLLPTLGLEVSPALVMFGEMLAVPLATMQTLIDDELDANDALEREEPDECPVCRGHWRRSCPFCSTPVNSRSDLPPAAAFDSGEYVSDAEQLRRDVALETCSEERHVVDYVIGCLDNRGLLDRPVEVVATETGAPMAVVERVLAIVRRLGPPGVGATSPGEALVLQLDALALDDSCADLARVVISDHLEALARGNFAAIASSLGVTRAEVHGALRLIRDKLRPYPAFEGNIRPQAVRLWPDIVVREGSGATGGCAAGDYVVELVEPALNRLRVRETAVGSASARAFISQLHGRWETVRRVAELAVGRQTAFLRDGEQALVPLTRAETATALGLHESTVSRAVADKYVMLPDRTLIPLAHFFGSAGGLDEELRRLVAEEPTPSDQRLADRLRDAGYHVARRTVAKHRARLGIVSSALR